jgi:hypothetical protein
MANLYQVKKNYSKNFTPYPATMTKHQGVTTSPTLYKSILAIPYFIIDGKINVLSVLDDTYKEWGFISGRALRHESSETALIREVFEETKECLTIDPSQLKNCKKFTKKILIPGKIRQFWTEYTVYFIKMPNDQNIEGIPLCFKNSVCKTKDCNENTDLVIGTLDEFKQKKLWDKMLEIIADENFIRIISEIEMENNLSPSTSVAPRSSQSPRRSNIDVPSSVQTAPQRKKFYNSKLNPSSSSSSK